MSNNIFKPALAWTVSFALSAPLAVAQETLDSPQLGKPVTQMDLSELDLIASEESVLPAGSGTAFQGREIYAAKCASCHGSEGLGGAANQPLVGGNMKSEEAPTRTVGSYWPHASTLFDYVRRAMPANAPKSLSNTEVYQVIAYVLYMNGLIDQYKVINAETLLALKMPNAGGFVDMSASD
ncbi:MAG: cytochrome c [Pseudomonadales bacterium]|jgi:S-disulfanyl-L-cysteine oxidoreductase SoxD|nr:cytochrome c [Pseudomonadales bacterium]MBL6803976.1 cytochrome c [Pseudomonadales bacterium]